MKQRLNQYKTQILLLVLYISACFNFRYLVSIVFDFMQESSANEYHNHRILGLIVVYGALLILLTLGIFILIQYTKQRKLNPKPKTTLERITKYCFIAITIFLPMLLGNIILPFSYSITIEKAFGIAALYLLLTGIAILSEKTANYAN